MADEQEQKITYRNNTTYPTVKVVDGHEIWFNTQRGKFEARIASGKAYTGSTIMSRAKLADLERIIMTGTRFSGGEALMRLAQVSREGNDDDDANT